MNTEIRNEIPSYANACAQVNAWLPFVWQTATRCAIRLGFKNKGLDTDDAISQAQFKFWKVAQTRFLPSSEDEAKAFLCAIIKRDLISLLRRTHDPRYAARYMPVFGGDDSKTAVPPSADGGRGGEGNAGGTGGSDFDADEDADNDADNDANEDADFDAMREAFSNAIAEGGAADDDGEFVATDATDAGETGSTGGGRFVDPAYVSNESAGQMSFVAVTEGADAAENAAQRLRSARIVHAALNEPTLAGFNRWLPADRRGRVAKDDLLSEKQRFVFRSYGSGLSAPEVLRLLEAQQFGLKTPNDIYNEFSRSWRHFWKLLKRIGFHWLDMRGSFRGNSLDANERNISMLGIAARKSRHATDFAAALLELYNTYSPAELAASAPSA